MSDVDDKEAELIVLLSIAALNDVQCQELRKKWAFEHGLVESSNLFVQPPSLASDFARDMHDDLDALAPDSDQVTVSDLWVYLSDLEINITPKVDGRGKSGGERKDELQDAIGRAVVAFCGTDSLSAKSIADMSIQDVAKQTILLSRLTGLLNRVADGKASTASALPKYWNAMASASLPFKGKVYSVGTEIKARWRGKKKKKWFFGKITAVHFVEWGKAGEPLSTRAAAAGSTGIPLYDIFYPADNDKDKKVWPHHVCERKTPIRVNDALFQDGAEGASHLAAVRAVVACAPAAQAGDGLSVPREPAREEVSGAAGGGGGGSEEATGGGGSTSEDPPGEAEVAPQTAASTSPRPGDEGNERKKQTRGSTKDHAAGKTARSRGGGSSGGEAAGRAHESGTGEAGGSRQPESDVSTEKGDGKYKEPSTSDEPSGRRPKAPSGARPSTGRASGRSMPRVRADAGSSSAGKGSSSPPSGGERNGDGEDALVDGFRQALAKGSAPSLEALFGALDETGDGRLNATELLRASEVLGVPATERQLQSLIAKNDPDGSGQLDAEEFARMCAPRGAGGREAASGAGADEEPEVTRWNSGGSVSSDAGDEDGERDSGGASNSPHARMQRVARAVRGSSAIRQVREKVRQALKSRTATDEEEGALAFLEKVFQVLDSDSSGRISPGELRRAARQLGVEGGISSAESEELCSALSGGGRAGAGKASDGAAFEDFATLVLLPEEQIGEPGEGGRRRRGRSRRGGSLVARRGGRLPAGRARDGADRGSEDDAKHPLDEGWPPGTISDRQARAIEGACDRLAQAVRDAAHVDDLYDKLVARSRQELAAEMRSGRGSSFSSVGVRLPEAPEWWKPASWQEEQDLEQLGVLEQGASRGPRRPGIYGQSRGDRVSGRTATRQPGSVSVLGLYQVLHEVGAATSLEPSRAEEDWARDERQRLPRGSSRGRLGASASTRELVMARGARLCQVRLAGEAGEAAGLGGESAARVNAQRFLAMVRRCSKGRSGGGGGRLGRRVSQKFERAARDCLRSGRCKGLQDIQPVSLTANAVGGGSARRPAPRGRRTDTPFSRSDYSRSLSRSDVDALMELDGGRMRGGASDLLLVAIRRHELLGRHQQARRRGDLSSAERREEQEEDKVLAKLQGNRLRADDLRSMRERLARATRPEDDAIRADRGEMTTKDNPAARLLMGLSVGETKVLLGAVGLQCTNAEVAAFVCQLDGDGDGVLSGHEVLSLLETGEGEGAGGKADDLDERGTSIQDGRGRSRSRDRDSEDGGRERLSRRDSFPTSRVRLLSQIEGSVVAAIGRSTRGIAREGGLKLARRRDEGQFDVAQALVLPSLPGSIESREDSVVRSLEREGMLGRVTRAAAQAFRDGQHRSLREHLCESRREQSEHHVRVDSAPGRAAMARLAMRIGAVSASLERDREDEDTGSDRRRGRRDRKGRDDRGSWDGRSSSELADRVVRLLERVANLELGRSDRRDIQDALSSREARDMGLQQSAAGLIAAQLAAPQAMVLAAFCFDEVRAQRDDVTAARDFLRLAEEAGEGDGEGAGGVIRRTDSGLGSRYHPERTWRSKGSSIPREQYRLAQGALRRLKRFWKRQKRHYGGGRSSSRGSSRGSSSRFDAANLASSLDSNGDGRISRSEFNRWLAREARNTGPGGDLLLSEDEKDALWAACDPKDRDAVRTRDFVALCVGRPDLSHLDVEASTDTDRVSQWENDGSQRRYRRDDDGDGGGRYYSKYGRRDDESTEDRDRRWKDRMEAVRRTTRAEVSAMILRRIRQRLGGGDIEGGLVQVFEAADRDGDGYMGRDEFVSVLVACGAAVKSRSQRSFDEQSTDVYDRQLSLMDCDLLFSAFDHDGDGAMDLDEFIRWVETGEDTLEEWEEQQEVREQEESERDWARGRSGLSPGKRRAYHENVEKGSRQRRQAKALLLMQRQFKAALRRGKVRSVSELMALFDEGSDGRVTVGEFERSLEKVGVNVTARDLAAISDRLDANGDGYVSSKELRELVEGRGTFSRLEAEVRAPLVAVEEDGDEGENGRREFDGRSRGDSDRKHDERSSMYRGDRGGDDRDRYRGSRTRDVDRRRDDDDDTFDRRGRLRSDGYRGRGREQGEKAEYEDGGRYRDRDAYQEDERRRGRYGEEAPPRVYRRQESESFGHSGADDSRRRLGAPRGMPSEGGYDRLSPPRDSAAAGYDFPMPPQAADLSGDGAAGGIPRAGKDLLLRRAGYSRLTEKLAQIKMQCQGQIISAFEAASSTARNRGEKSDRERDSHRLPPPGAVLRFLLEQFKDRDIANRGVLPRRTVFQVLARVGVRLSKEEQMCVRSAYRVRHPAHERRLQRLRASGATLGGGSSSAVQVGDGTVAAVHSAEHAELDYGRLAYLLAAPNAHAALELERVEEEARRRAGARSIGRQHGPPLGSGLGGDLGLPLDSLLGGTTGAGMLRRSVGRAGDGDGVLGALGLGEEGLRRDREVAEAGGATGEGAVAAAAASVERVLEEMLSRESGERSVGQWLQVGGSRVERVAVALLGQSLTALEARLGLEGCGAPALGRLLDAEVRPKGVAAAATGVAGVGLTGGDGGMLVPTGLAGGGTGAWGRGGMGTRGRWMPPQLRSSMSAAGHAGRRSAAGPLLHPDGGDSRGGRGDGRQRAYPDSEGGDFISLSALRSALRARGEREADADRGRDRDRGRGDRRALEDAMRLIDRAMDDISRGKDGRDISRGASIVEGDTRSPFGSRRTSLDGGRPMLDSGMAEEAVVVQLGAKLEAHLAFRLK